ncbi:leucine-rich repeat domain-containing protein [Bacteriovorax sp. Seq25_V]|uniref:leucine-rich repeat domain-containing protein n=1 Tax=Bacteriovorax sp. Seq25_V TaxID=1201288 RepID=UPI00038A044F|nr:leucine-rich repeat domain-containing protein [Bacteriovorax sp. Seq25_V]EQC44235.1 leucine rich repeat protein [Bacteriovorax sp. Seq25_V]
MSSLVIKLRKGVTEINWDKYDYHFITRVEIFSNDLAAINCPTDFPTDRIKSVELNCPALKKLPSFLGSCLRLEILKIKNCVQINFDNHEYDFDVLKTLQLANLELKEVPKWLAICHELETLDLQGNAICELPDFLKELKAIRRINLDHNRLTHLPNFLKDLPKLNHLSVDGNQFDEDEVLRINQVFKITI